MTPIAMPGTPAASQRAVMRLFASCRAVNVALDCSMGQSLERSLGYVQRSTVFLKTIWTKKTSEAPIIIGWPFLHGYHQRLRNM
jgi:hypothetical protein